MDKWGEYQTETFLGLLCKYVEAIDHLLCDVPKNHVSIRPFTVHLAFTVHLENHSMRFCPKLQICDISKMSWMNRKQEHWLDKFALLRHYQTTGVLLGVNRFNWRQSRKELMA
ncbi:MAG: hypothetical protein ABJM43_16145 [Paracoccaceae bacterium]